MLERFFYWLGYIPKQDFEFKIEFEQDAAWPFPVEKPAKKKPTVKKATTRTAKKPAVKKTTKAK